MQPTIKRFSINAINVPHGFVLYRIDFKFDGSGFRNAIRDGSIPIDQIRDQIKESFAQANLSMVSLHDDTDYSSPVLVCLPRGMSTLLRNRIMELVMEAFRKTGYVIES